MAAKPAGASMAMSRPDSCMDPRRPAFAGAKLRLRAGRREGGEQEISISKFISGQLLRGRRSNPSMTDRFTAIFAELSALDRGALIWFLVAWGGYTLAADHLLDRPLGLNQHMKRVREQWFRRMIEHPERLLDANLVGHVIHSVSFFISTTMIVLAGLIGLLGAFKQAYQVATGLAFVAETSPELFELKLLLLIAIFIYGFLRFTWAIRQLNYACAMIGAAPWPPVEEEAKTRYARQIAQVLTLGMVSFNGGLRAYYFALAALGWLVHPWLFILLTTAMLLVLLRRQLYSRTYRAIRELTGEL
jgi:uncharacterized membrane protein